VVFAGHEVTYFFARSQQGGSADLLLDGALVATVDFSGPAPGNAPEFGHALTLDGLEEGTHELVIVHRSGTAYVDGFEIVAAGEQGGADASAAASSSTTTTSSAKLSPLGLALVETVEVGATDEWLSVVVDGAPGLAVALLDPLGALAAEGGQLLPGVSAVGLDVTPALAGLYTVQVVDPAGSTATVEISISRTAREE
jgi:hypothetical protein